jgi:hypothetical protein
MDCYEDMNDDLCGCWDFTTLGIITARSLRLALHWDGRNGFGQAFVRPRNGLLYAV